jgi:hypothetical protein
MISTSFLADKKLGITSALEENIISTRLLACKKLGVTSG